MKLVTQEKVARGLFAATALAVAYVLAFVPPPPHLPKGFEYIAGYTMNEPDFRSIQQAINDANDPIAHPNGPHIHAYRIAARH